MAAEGRMKEITASGVRVVKIGSGQGAGTMKQTGSGGGSAVPTYHGETTFTPSQNQQIVQVSGYRMADDITIEPIPSNYGLVTWNGAVLTVS